MTDSTSPQRPLTFSSAKWSALVDPMFRMATGIFLSLAASKNLYPEYTFGTTETDTIKYKNAEELCCKLQIHTFS